MCATVSVLVAGVVLGVVEAVLVLDPRVGFFGHAATSAPMCAMTCVPYCSSAA